MLDRIATWSINLAFILVTFAFFYLVVAVVFNLSMEAEATLASLLTIALSDLYLRGSKDN